MKIDFLFVGSTKTDYVESALQLYLKRLQRFCKIEVKCTPNLRGIQRPEDQREQEADQVLKNLNKTDILILLDEKGKSFGSVSLATHIENLRNQGIPKLVFLVCGAFGAHAKIKSRANMILSLSSLTFSHQLARVVLAEQVYRAFTIINNHPYHNEG